MQADSGIAAVSFPVSEVIMESSSCSSSRSEYGPHGRCAARLQTDALGAVGMVHRGLFLPL